MPELQFQSSGSTQGRQSHRRLIVANRKDADQAISKSPFSASIPVRNRRCKAAALMELYESRAWEEIIESGDCGCETRFPA